MKQYVHTIKAFFSTKKSRHFLVWVVGIGGVFIISLMVLFFFVPPYSRSQGFTTLEEVGFFIESIPEHPPLDNDYLVRPDYTTFYAKSKAGYFSSRLRTLMSWLRLGKQEYWSPSFFAHLLQQTVTKQKENPVSPDTIAKISPTAGTKFIVWGDLLGALHSLYRTLKKLQDLSILNNYLKITDPTTYFVFMGDTMSRSAYGMQTLSLIFKLMEVNPEQVIYLRGNHESKKYWHAFGLKDQVQALAAHYFKPEDIVVALDECFKQLPLALYVRIPHSTHEYVRFSHEGREESRLLKEEKYDTFLTTPQSQVLEWHHLERGASATPSPIASVSAIMRAEKKRDTYQKMNGLRLLAPEQGATAWTMLSAPTTVNQKGLGFSHDAFSLITVGTEKSSWRISLYSQESTFLKGFEKETFAFFEGTTASPLAQSPVSVASTDPLSTSRVQPSDHSPVSQSINQNALHTTSIPDSPAKQNLLPPTAPIQPEPEEDIEIIVYDESETHESVQQQRSRENYTEKKEAKEPKSREVRTVEKILPLNTSDVSPHQKTYSEKESVKQVPSDNTSLSLQTSEQTSEKKDVEKAEKKEDQVPKEKQQTSPEKENGRVNKQEQKEQVYKSNDEKVVVKSKKESECTDPDDLILEAITKKMGKTPHVVYVVVPQEKEEKSDESQEENELEEEENDEE